MNKKPADILCIAAALFGLLAGLGGIWFSVPAILLGGVGFFMIRKSVQPKKGRILCGFAVVMGMASILFYLV